jgi:hypothetical protein
LDLSAFESPRIANATPVPKTYIFSRNESKTRREGEGEACLIHVCWVEACVEWRRTAKVPTAKCSFRTRLPETWARCAELFDEIKVRFHEMKV